MSFFAFANRDLSGRVAGLSLDLIRKHECAVCPLDHAPGLKHPKMEATGAKKPLVYIIGEAAGKEEDYQGKQFVGPSGKLLRQYIPDKYIDHIRWNNIIQCRPPIQNGKQTAPTEIMLTACSPRIERDVETTKPKAIFSFGATALWLIKESGISRWSGRQIPIKIGSHKCWLFPFVHPASILYEESQVKYINKHAEYKTELETQFATQLRAAFSIVEKLPEPVVWDRESILADIELVTGAGGESDIEQIVEFLHDLNHEEHAGFDYETSCLRPWLRGAKILSVAWSGQEKALSVALDHKDAKWRDGQLERLFRYIKNFMQKRKVKLISHHLPFELEWTAYTFGDDLLWKPPLWEDTESQAFILDERQNALSLEFLCQQYLGINIKAIDNLDRKNLAEAPLEPLLRYNGLDSKGHRLLFEAQSKRIRKEGLGKVYDHQRDRTIATTAVSMRGIPIDQKANRALLDKYMPRLRRLEQRIALDPDIKVYEKTAKNPYRASAAQDARMFVERVLGKRLNNSDAQSLGDIKHPVIVDTLKWRKINKIVSTYALPVTAGYPEWNIPPSTHLLDDGWVRPSLHTTRTRTNRTSSSEPNSQNWPTRTKQGLEARRQVAPSEDYRVVAFDYSGIQARAVAWESKDSALVKAFFENYDIHTDWMERIQRICDRRHARWIPGGLKAAKEDKDVAKLYRYAAKNKFVFPSFFGAQAPSISRNLGLPVEVAYEAHEEFWDKFPHIRDWQQRTIRNYYKIGYVVGLSGFRRHAPVAYTELINAPIQADEALIVCDAMIRLCRKGIVPNLEIHDDLTFIWHKRDIDKLSEIVITEMLTINFPWVNVPLAVEQSIGTNWADKEKAGEFDSETWFGKKKHKPDPNDGNWSEGTGWQGMRRHQRG